MITKVNWKDDKEIRGIISQLISDKKLFPVFGSGFTTGCKARTGVVPTGKEMIKYMSEFLSRVYNKTIEEYEKRNFSDLCTLYSKKSSINEKFDYFSSNFTEVILEETKKTVFIAFFSIRIHT